MSDHSQVNPRRFVVGTAGHIDHGKTSLVAALTGVDTDRLAEEKRRGISIELGFAHLRLAGGESISFVDVPGHENFIKNMLAGTTGIGAVMLIVSANEGVKPQTREHLDICRLLEVGDGFVVLTKADLAAPDQLEFVRHQVAELCEGSFLEGKPVLPVSVKTGLGLDAVRTALTNLAALHRTENNAGFARLPIDRSFAITGFGTVVTGTLWAGRLNVGDTVVIHPTTLECRIRGLQVHGEPVPIASGGERVAVNLAGVDHTQIERGMVLAPPSPLAPTSIVDASVRWLHGAVPPTKQQQVLVHVGTAEIPASIKMLDGQSMARLRLTRPALLLPEDHFVLRRPSPAATIAGGVVLDPFPLTRRSRLQAVERLSTFAKAQWPRRLELLVARSAGGRSLADLVRSTGLPEEQILHLVKANRELAWLPFVGRVVSARWVFEMRGKMVTFLQDFHRKYPSLSGAPMAQARLHLDVVTARAVLADFPAVQIKGDVVAITGYRPVVSSEQTRVLASVEEAFRRAGYQPPAASEVLRELGTDPASGRPLLESLIKNQRLVKISDDFLLHADVIQHIRVSLAAHKGRRFSVPEFKEWTQVSRKYAIPLLEYLDRQRVTRRDGDARVIL